jgi:hypothetical protein
MQVVRVRQPDLRSEPRDPLNTRLSTRHNPFVLHFG